MALCLAAQPVRDIIIQKNAGTLSSSPNHVCLVNAFQKEGPSLRVNVAFRGSSAHVCCTNRRLY